MKMGTIRIESNDDGTYQVEVEARNEEVGYPGGKCLKYSASSLEDVVGKIKEAQSKIGSMKTKKKEKKGKNNSLATFIKGEEADD